LETFGAMWVGLTGKDGSALELATDSKGLGMEFQSSSPVHFERLGAPPTLWEFDQALGKWKQEPIANLAVDGWPLPHPGQDPSTVNLLQAAKANAPENPRMPGMMKKGLGGDEYHMLTHHDFLDGSPNWTPEAFTKFFGKPIKRAFSLTEIPRAGYWNCDAAYITTFLRGCIVDADGAPITKANVWTEGANYSGASPRSGLNESGNFSILAQQKCSVIVVVLLPGSATEETEAISKPIRFRFGPFETGQSGESNELGILNLSQGDEIVA